VPSLRGDHRGGHRRKHGRKWRARRADPAVVPARQVNGGRNSLHNWPARSEAVPQGLKLRHLCDFFGMAEAMPLQNGLNQFEFFCRRDWACGSVKVLQLQFFIHRHRRGETWQILHQR
jgi:hypothetical protein